MVAFFLSYAVNSGASVGLFAYNATVFTSPSFRDHSYKSTASLSSSFFYSSGEQLDSPTVDRKGSKSIVTPSSNRSSPVTHRNNNVQSTPSFSSPSSPLAAGASRPPSSLPFNTTVDYSRHVARSSNIPKEQAGLAESPETLRPHSRTPEVDRDADEDSDGDEDGDDEEHNDGDDENHPAEATVAQPAQREQGRRLLVPQAALSVTSRHPLVTPPSAPPLHDGPPHATRFERLEIDDSSGRPSYSRFEAPWRRSKGKSANRRSRRSSATTNKLPRSSRGLRQQGQRVK